MQIQGQSEHAPKCLEEALQVLDAQEGLLTHMRIPDLCERVAQLDRRHACITAEHLTMGSLLYGRCTTDEAYTGNEAYTGILELSCVRIKQRTKEAVEQRRADNSICLLAAVVGHSELQEVLGGWPALLIPEHQAAQQCLDVTMHSRAD